MTIAVDLGTAQGTAGPATIDLEELLATRLLVQGNSGSGKSHLLRRLLERSAPHVQQVVIDPEGDFVGLAEHFGHVAIDADRSPADLETVAARVREHRVSAVLNLESLDAEAQMRASALFLNALFEADRRHWYPVLVVVDEAQLFAPAVSGDVSEEARKLSLGAMTNLMCRGRKRGLAGVIATQRLAKLAKNVAAEATNFLMGRTFLDIDMARAADLLGLERRQAEVFRDLQRGQFMALGPALARRPLAIVVGSVETEARAGTPRLTPPPEPLAEDARERILAPLAGETSRAPAERRPPSAPAPSMNQILEQIVRDRPAPVAAEEQVSQVTAEERAGAERAIVHDMLDRSDAPFRPEAVLYQDFRVRCRVARLGPQVTPLADFRLLLNEGRAGLHLQPSEVEAWSRARAMAAMIPDDLQAVFFILAAAAFRGAPCPSDREISRRCGHHSAGRARSRIGHLEKRDAVVMRREADGRRSVIVPDLGWTSGAGDPNAPGTVPEQRDAAE